MPSGPGFETENNLRLINYMIYNANRRITICSPYFVPRNPASGTHQRRLLRHQNHRDRVRKGRSVPAQHGAAFLLRRLLQAGVRILQYPSPTVLALKFMFMDDDLAFIGSSNMDPRSFSLNMEVSTFYRPRHGHHARRSRPITKARCDRVAVHPVG